MSTRPPDQSVRLSKTYVDGLKPPERGQRFLRDSELRGFAVRITANGTKSFILEKRIRGRVRRQTIARYPDLTVEQARKQAQVLLGQIALGVDPIAQREAERARLVTLAEAFEDFKRARRSLKPSTLYDYGRFMVLAFPDWQTRPLVEITRDMVQRRHQKLGERSGPAYANHALRCLSSILNFARERYDDPDGEPILTQNPVERLTRTKAWFRVERRRGVIKAHQLPAWCQAVRALRNGTLGDPKERIEPRETQIAIADLLFLLLFTGLRRQEAMTLTWGQVDLDESTLTIPDPKNREPLVLPLSDFVHELLARRAAAAKKDKDQGKGSPYVFPGSGKHGYLIEPKRSLARVKRVSGVEFMLHDLRRTFITIAERLDLGIYAIKRLVNHKMSSDVTAGYIITDVERLREPMQKITDFLIRAGELDDTPNIILFPSSPSSARGGNV